MGRHHHPRRQPGERGCLCDRNDGGSANARFDTGGYDYAIVLPSGGAIKVFDPGFCAMGSNGVAGSMGAGDHWIGTSGTPVSTYYSVWNSNGKLGLPGSWSQVYTSGNLFENQTGYDPANMGPDGTGTRAERRHRRARRLPQCLVDDATGALGAGTYVLQVQTSKTRPPSGSTDTSVNSGTNAENMWSIEAAGAGAPQVYGNGRMTVYNNLQATATPQQFYLAKIDQATGAGKTALIDLFDPGDISGTGTLQVFSPDGGSSHAVNFNYTTDGNCVNQTGTSPCGTHTNVSQFDRRLQRRTGHEQHVDPHQRPPGNAYGSSGLWKGGWWQIVYTTPDGGNDTTTWEVSVSGNPVHLLLP